MNETNKISTASYAFLGFLTLLNVMNFVDRQLLASFANFIVPDLGLSNTQFSLSQPVSFAYNSRINAASINVRVYSCCGDSKIFRASPCSTTVP